MPVKHFLPAFLLFLLTAPAAAAGDRPLVVASIKPLAMMANDLVGDRLRVETLLADNQEPHHLSLSMSQRRMLAKAELVLWVGPELESFLVGLTGEQGVGRALSFRDAVAGSGIALHREDAHYWLHPELAARFYRRLAEELRAGFPDLEAEIDRRLHSSLQSLTRLTGEIRRQLAGKDGNIVVDHQAYSYFAAFFQLQIAGALVDESGVAMGPRTVTSLANRSDVRCLVVEQLPASRRAEKVARILGVNVVAIDPLGRGLPRGRDYRDLLQSVADGFESCLVGPH